MFCWFQFCCISLNIFEIEGDIRLKIGEKEFGIVFFLNTAANSFEFGLNEEEPPYLFGLNALPIFLKNPCYFRLDINFCNLC